MVDDGCIAITEFRISKIKVLCMSSIAGRSMQGKIKTFLYSFLNKLAFVIAIIVLVSLGNSCSCKWYLTIYVGDVDSFNIAAVVVMVFALLLSFAFAVSATNSFKRNFCSISVMTPSCSANNFPMDGASNWGDY
uniref:Uncharacterized protein n=1 Tax=Glossina austeni TaxID=7395 RepID=A0A1A9UH64_GLOAU